MRSSRRPSVHGADLAGAFVLEVTIAFSLAVSWASYAADFSRYLPADSSRARVFGFTFAGIVLAYIFVQGIGIAAGDCGLRADRGGRAVGDGRRPAWRAGAAHHRAGVDRLGCDERLQRVAGAADDRGAGAAAGVGRDRDAAGAFALILWLHAADTATRFQNVLLLVSYWIPAFVSVVVIDWLLRIRGRATINPAEEPTDRRDAVAAVIVFVLAYAAAIPFMNTSLIEGPVARGVARRRRRVLRQSAGGCGAVRRVSTGSLVDLGSW